MNKLVSESDLRKAGLAPRNSIGAVLRGEPRPDLLRDEVLAEIFAATARRCGDQIAFAGGEPAWTYARVDAETDVIAGGLVAAGVGPGDVVGLWLPRGIDLLLAQVAVTKSGAAWLPFDADAPIERIGVCLTDADATGLLTAETFRDCAAETGRTVWTNRELRATSKGRPADPRTRGLTPDHPAYLIYTSGSTGSPKGIVVSHRNVCHFLRAANEVYGLVAEDVVFQGASVAFDLSVEEIWIPYLVGASLVVATCAVLGDVERLPEVLAQAGVSVLDTVPTLLSMLARDVPSLRLILLGGEALPPALVGRWAKPGRRLLNTYGPTEATVVATVAELAPGEPVTIGRPIPNYSCYVADENLVLMPSGMPGELLIGGPGVAAGYLARPQLTAEKFIANPFAGDGADPILYRSGDAVSVDAASNIAFHGRIDDQVKIRGFRVELGEIEARLAAFPGVGQAAVVLRQDEGLDRLVAFLVPEPGARIDRLALRLGLRDQLPSYMLPSQFEVTPALPRLASGKIDRKALKLTQLACGEAPVEEEPRTPSEAALLAAAKRVFPGQAIPFEADFFTELGGHSLIAARFVSAVRELPALADITLQDVYGARSLRAMAARLDARAPTGEPGAAADLTFSPPPLKRRFLCGLAQAAAMPFILGLVTIQWLGLFLASIYVLQEDASLTREMAVLLGVYILLNLGTKALIIALKWLVIGRTKPGRYPLWGAYYFRLWLVQRLTQVTTIKFLQSSPLMRLYMRLLGARIGRDAIIGDFEAGAIDLIAIGEGSSIGAKTKFANVEVVGNEVIVGPITIADDVYAGNACVFGPHTRLGSGAELGDLTAVPAGTTIGAREHWDGSPARKLGLVDAKSLPAHPQAGPARRALQGTAYGLGYVLILMLGLVPIFPAFYVLYNLDSLIDGVPDYVVSWSMLPLLAFPTALALIVVSMLIIIAVRWAVLPRVRSGSFSIHSWFYVRKWMMGLATEVTLETLGSLYATLYMRGWYRMMGARIGKGSEISTNLAGRYDLVDIGENNFLGDEVIFGDEEVRRGWMTLRAVKTGDRVFLGNDSIVPGGSVLADGALIGVKSKMPASLSVGADETWFGSPPIQLPVRQKFDMGATWTYEPSARRLLGRAVFEAVHTTLPTAIFITCGYMTADLVSGPLETGDWAGALGIFLASGLVIAAVLVLVTVAVKWALMGVYKPIAKPMWSWWAMRTEAVAVLYGGLVGKASVEFMRGTPFLPWILRLFGAKIGRGVWMDCTDVTEFDCVRIGDFASLNMVSCLQTHLYEDRVMKVGRVAVGRGVSIGAGTTVLYDTHVGDFARLGPLTLVMKGEDIPAHSQWAGAPAERVVAEAREGAVALKVAA